jgi:hypothetical protein
MAHRRRDDAKLEGSFESPPLRRISAPNPIRFKKNGLFAEAWKPFVE